MPPRSAQGGSSGGPLMWSRTYEAAASSARRGHLRRPALQSERRRRRGAVSDTPSTRRRIGESRFDAIDAVPYRPFRRRHQAAKKEKRHVCVEDLAAVAEDLVKTGVAQHESLGIRGGSNGGLLVGNFFVQRPELVGAVVCAVTVQCRNQRPRRRRRRVGAGRRRRRRIHRRRVPMRRCLYWT